VPIMLLLALVSIAGLKRRLGGLEQEVALLRAGQVPVPDAVSPAPRPIPAPREPTLSELVSKPATQQSATTSPPLDPSLASEPAPMPRPGMPPPLPDAARVTASPPLPPRDSRPLPAHKPGVSTVAIRAIKRWFTVGNVPVKIGMLVLLAGVAALLKYASDQGWLTVPIELRLAAIAATAMAGLVFGWRQRDDKRAFALALQGGAIGVLLLTIFAASRMYGLMPAAAAFALSVVLVASMGVLAVVQDSKTLAVLGILAGFMAPIWLSTGSGNHVALFSYYALLNAAILVIAWWRPWRVLNLLGFVFTFGIGTLWGVLQYDPSKFTSTEPFLLLFFAFYLLIPMLYARRQPASRGDFIDGCLVFATPLITFSLQAALLDGMDGEETMTLALCGLGLGVLYASLAWTFIRRERYRALGQSYALLGVGFATLAVPLALSARATASVFALEGAALVWLGLRQQRWLPQATGALLQLAAAVGLLIGVSDYWPDENAIANPTFMGALLIALAGFASAWAYRLQSRSRIALAYYLWALLWWCGTGLNEITRFVELPARADVLLALVAFTGWLAAEVHQRRPAPALVLTTLAGFVAALPLAVMQAEVHQHPFAGNGSWAWLLFAALGVRSLLCLRVVEDRYSRWAQFAWWLLWPSVLSLLASWLAQRFVLAQGWEMALIALPWLAAMTVSLLRWPWLAMPLGARFDRCRSALQMSLLCVLGLWWLACLWLPGDASPLPWLPLINPTELAQLVLLALAATWLWSPQAPGFLQRSRLLMLAGAGFVMITWTTLRSVHHWGGVAWTPELLGTSLAQTSLTLVWSVLGVLGWVIGSRRGQRGLWLGGALLMAVVLAKLVLVDRGNLGNGLGIASFIAYGLLCTVVGYLAPAPPRAVVEEVPA